MIQKKITNITLQVKNNDLQYAISCCFDINTYVTNMKTVPSNKSKHNSSCVTQLC